MFEAKLQDTYGLENLYAMCRESGTVHAPLQAPQKACHTMLTTAEQRRLEEHSTAAIQA
jgi:hypothetical protein